MKNFLAAVVAAALSAACATGPYVQTEAGIGRVVDLINRGGVPGVRGLSTAPFIFDGEILLLDDDVKSLWTNLAAAGFKLEGVKVASIDRVDEESYKAFGTTMDVRIFFRKYTDQDTSMVKLTSRSGTFFLLLNNEVRGYPRIQGFKGPVS